MVHFTSIGGVYEVDCPGDKCKGIEKYVNRFAAMFVELERLLAPLPPSFRTFNVSFERAKKSKYMGKGRIIIRTHSAKGNPRDFGAKAENPECFGGLFHETIHGVLDKYINRPQGHNVHPREALALSVQWAAVRRINSSAAKNFEISEGEHPDKTCWFVALRAAQEECGEFDPIRMLLEEMSRSDEPVFRQVDNYIADVNRLWMSRGLRCQLPSNLPSNKVSLGNA